MQVDLKVGRDGGDQISMLAQKSDDYLSNVEINIVGKSSFLSLVHEWRPHFGKKIDKIPLPEGASEEALVLKELILRLQDKWEPPYTAEELCHCRLVPTAKVQEAILLGARENQTVGQMTSAGTGCGTCSKDIDAMISYYAKN